MQDVTKSISFIIYIGKSKHARVFQWQLYSSSDLHFPNGVCTGYNIVSWKRKDPSTALPVVDNYDPERKTDVRQVNTCTYKICSVANLNGKNFFWHHGKIKRNVVDQQQKQFPRT